ncbi:MAG: arginine repressor [Gemmatimonadota bacterium]
MSRGERERVILQIVGAGEIHTQAELVRALAGRGIRITQATVSRDIKRLGLVKVPTADGGYRYAAPELVNHPARGATARETARENLRNAFQEFVIGLKTAQGIVVVRTHTGCANAVAVTIDEAELPEVAATLAGDDTIFVLPESAGEADRVLAELRGLAGR